MRENKFQKKVIDAVLAIPGSLVLKNDSSYIQGIPDLSVFCGNKYAMLEVKQSATAPHQPNQDFYISQFSDWGAFAAFIYPENFDHVLAGLKGYFGTEGSDVSV